MSKGIVLRGREQRTMLDLINALGASLDLHAVVNDAYPLLLSLIGADYGALAATRSDRADEYEWIVQNLPPSFLASYEDMAPHDFVRSSVLAKINVVVRDSEMLDRRSLERNMMYHRARDVGSPIEQVMAVMLHAGDGFQSGLSLYRDRRRPFTDREQRILQQVTPAIANAVRNCRSVPKDARSAPLLGMLLGSKQGAVVVQSSGREVDRTASATALMEAWFTPAERGGERLPRVLLDALVRAQVARTRGDMGPWFYKKERDGATLRVELRPWTELVGALSWVLVLCEVSHARPVPTTWQALLTKTEIKVVSRIILGWDSRLIAEYLNCKSSTVKVHVKHVLDKLGFPDCKTLIVRATIDP
jgi:DNA-binding CsgD family transcriptional regulator